MSEREEPITVEEFEHLCAKACEAFDAVGIARKYVDNAANRTA